MVTMMLAVMLSDLCMPCKMQSHCMWRNVCELTADIPKSACNAVIPCMPCRLHNLAVCNVFAMYLQHQALQVKNNASAQEHSLQSQTQNLQGFWHLCKACELQYHVVSSASCIGSITSAVPCKSKESGDAEFLGQTLLDLPTLSAGAVAAYRTDCTPYSAGRNVSGKMKLMRGTPIGLKNLGHPFCSQPLASWVCSKPGCTATMLSLTFESSLLRTPTSSVDPLQSLILTAVTHSKLGLQQARVHSNKAIFDT